jgi:patatin-like phospholipase/acyl hydrolase
MPRSNPRLLALDASSVCGLSTLQILKQLIDTIDLELPPKPCDYFDMIGSTSTSRFVVTTLPNAPLTRSTGL